MPKKKANARKSAVKPDYNNLQINDVLCPICRSILLEPVTLPCSHSFCYVCFNDTMENANLVCPLCRLRVSSWLRGAKKDQKLVNDTFWAAIKKQYQKAVQNKYSGIEYDFGEEKPVILMSSPGEIRKEYEVQKQKEDEELRKFKEAEEKASEELIERLRKEEEYNLALEEEKLRLDAELAKKLSQELLPSTSSISNNSKKGKKIGPMDKFIKSDFGKSNKSMVNSNSTSTFANKEYTCRVICLDKETKPNALKNNLYKNSVVPAFQKKIQQIQKILENEEASRSRNSKSDGSSDIIESEYKFYFKPINFQNNPPTQKSSPIKIPSKKVVPDKNNKLLSPTGMIDFQPNILKSAFVRLSIELAQKEQTKPVPSKPINKSPLKRKQKDMSLQSPVVPAKKNGKLSLTKEIFLQKNQSSKSDSPPFYGFDLSSTKSNSGSSSTVTSEDNKNKEAEKLQQEQADYEFAKRLQEALNKESVNTRSRRGVKRQVTLDEMLLA